MNSLIPLNGGHSLCIWRPLLQWALFLCEEVKRETTNERIDCRLWS